LVGYLALEQGLLKLTAGTEPDGFGLLATVSEIAKDGLLKHLWLAQSHHWFERPPSADF